MTVHELRAEDLGVESGGRLLLSGIDLVATAGHSVALTGPSGSGKTVLLHTLAGLLSPARGRIVVDGSPLNGTHRRAATIGLVLQHHGLAAGLTAEENVALPLQARGLDRGDIAIRCREALDAVDLAASEHRLVDELSGGQRQRVGVARALAGRPDVLLADEPTAELDPANRGMVLSLLLDPSCGRIVVVASNDPEVARACDHVLHLRDGRLQSDR